MSEKKPKPCGNPDCSVSTGIHDGFTFGSGDLDMNGFWEHPCALCARLHEKLYPEDGRCWPFEPMTRADMLRAEAEILEMAKGKLNDALDLLKSLMGTMCDRVAGQSDARFEYNQNIIEGEVADAVACAKDNLGKVEIPEA